MPTITRDFVARPPPVPEGQDKLRVFDDKQPGFFIEVRSSGIVTFYVRYRDPRRRQRDIRIGRLGEVTLDQAKRRAKELRAAAALGDDPAADLDRLRAVPTFAAFMQDRYLPHQKGRIKSYRDQESFFRLRLKSWLGNLRLDEVRPTHIADMQDRLKREGLSDATVNRYVAMVKHVFSLALHWEVYEGRNTATKADMKREQHRERFLGEPELRRLFQALGDEPNRVYATLIAFLVTTGARRGEAMNARWEHIDFERQFWTIPISKSGKKRFIPLGDSALQLLAGLPGPASSPWVFPGRDPTKPVGCIKKTWVRVKEAAGIAGDLRIHDLRHTFASLLAGNGRSLQVIGRLLGHSSTAMTLRYAHLCDDHLREAANLALPSFGDK